MAGAPIFFLFLFPFCGDVMAVRTTTAAVKSILGQQSSSGKAGNYDGQTDLSPFIETASSLVDDLVAAATEEGEVIIAAKAELIERWLSAHQYTMLDPLYAAKSTKDSSGTFRDQSFLSTALQLDPTGLLSGIIKGQRVGGFWAGTREADARTYDDRNEVS
jgi:hypothetical protein